MGWVNHFKKISHPKKHWVVRKTPVQVIKPPKPKIERLNNEKNIYCLFFIALGFLYWLRRTFRKDEPEQKQQHPRQESAAEEHAGLLVRLEIIELEMVLEREHGKPVEFGPSCSHIAAQARAGNKKKASKEAFFPCLTNRSGGRVL